GAAADFADDLRALDAGGAGRHTAPQPRGDHLRGVVRSGLGAGAGDASRPQLVVAVCARGGRATSDDRGGALLAKTSGLVPAALVAGGRRDHAASAGGGRVAGAGERGVAGAGYRCRHGRAFGRRRVVWLYGGQPANGRRPGAARAAAGRHRPARVVVRPESLFKEPLKNPKVFRNILR